MMVTNCLLKKTTVTFIYFSAQADHIVIDTTTLEKLLHALDARSISGWYHPAMRMQNELIAAKEREISLVERVRVCENMMQTTVGAKPIRSGQNKDQENQTVDTESETNEIFVSKEHPMTSLDNILQQLSDQDVELDHLRSEMHRLNEDFREAVMTCESLKEVEQQFDDLTQVLSRSEDEQIARLAAQSDEMVQLKTKCAREERKRQFVQEDYDQLKRLYKKRTDHHNQLIYELRKHLTDLETKPPVSKLTSSNPQSNNELQTELEYLKSTMIRISESALSKFVDYSAIGLPNVNFESFGKIGIIEDDLTLSFLTKTEWSSLNEKCKELSERNANLDRQCCRLEKLYQLAQIQVINLLYTICV